MAVIFTLCSFNYVFNLLIHVRDMQKKITESVLEICKAKNFPGSWVQDGCEINHSLGMGIHILQACQHGIPHHAVSNHLNSGSNTTKEALALKPKFPNFVLYKKKTESDEIADQAIELDTLDELSDTLEFLSALFKEESGTIESLESTYGVSVKEGDVTDTQRWLRIMAGNYEGQTEYTDYSQCSCLAGSTINI